MGKHKKQKVESLERGQNMAHKFMKKRKKKTKLKKDRFSSFLKNMLKGLLKLNRTSTIRN